ncbi:MAG: phosphonate ABC transporter, permease protein PhnE [Pikeienuella sp.]|uniref:phosphonate ABC transporter, permease protein PhnE n=1 Tax=Pikeienuella sp. TaxID=2831957 RepID=UPI00391AFA80
MSVALGGGHREAAHGLFRRKRIVAFGVPAAILLYFVYIFFAFDLPGLAQRARLDNAAILVSDFWSYKTHVTKDNRNGEITAAIEGEAKGAYPAGTFPDWVEETEGGVRIALRDGHAAVFEPEGARYLHPEFGEIVLRTEGRRIALVLPPALSEVPDWINASDTRVAINTEAGRLSLTRNRTEAFRYFAGWELFFFTLDSPFSGRSLGELTALALWEPRIDEARSNLGYMLSEFWTNRMWRHGDVAWAIFETILMAFLGTMGAAIIALPLGFVAAKNFAPAAAARFGVRRLFDFLRGVDGLIWTIILSRAFGPGPLTGSLAILITDTGTFGKIFSEALENVDEKQIEGVRSTGAKPVQRYRFGVIPQVMPVILSQVLYYLESNTRSATVIGAIVGGGIGLLLTQAIITQKDWEEVTYYMVLIVLMVMFMDTVSGWLRRRLIKGA